MRKNSILISALFLVALFCFPLAVSAVEDTDNTTTDTCTTHYWVRTYEYQKIDDYRHGQIYKCSNCGATKIQDTQQHEFDYYDYTYEPLDDENHYLVTTCVCGATKKEIQPHDMYYSPDVEWLNGYYHVAVDECLDCGERVIVEKGKHDWGSGECLRLATLTKKGIVTYECYDCYGDLTKYKPWKLHTYYSASYDIVSHSYVYKKSKSMTVRLNRSLKGAVLKVTLGKKSFKKKITNKQKKQKIKIKKPKYGSKITIKLYYKGKLVGTDNCYGDYLEDHVLYGKKIKKGMSKKKVKCLYSWGPPWDTATASGGWSYWYYYNGSWVAFKNGKVKSWYKQ